MVAVGDISALRDSWNFRTYLPILEEGIFGALEQKEVSRAVEVRVSVLVGGARTPETGAVANGDGRRGVGSERAGGWSATTRTNGPVESCERKGTVAARFRSEACRFRLKPLLVVQGQKVEFVRG